MHEVVEGCGVDNVLVILYFFVSGLVMSSTSPGHSSDDDISLSEFFEFLSSACKLNSCFNDKTRQDTRIRWEELTGNQLVLKLLERNRTVAAAETKYTENAVPGKSTSTVKSVKSKLLRRLSSEESAKILRAGVGGGEASKTVDGIADRLFGQLDLVLSEGILDSVLPFMVPKLTFSESVARIKSLEQAKKASEEQVSNTTKELLGMMKGSFDKNNDVEIEILVCDEVRHKTKIFKCPRNLLLAEMAYFADVTSGRLEDMDISVHCDLTIFEWLMKWMKSSSNTSAENNVPHLHNSNVIPVLVSATFLQMNPLIQECIGYFKTNVDDVIRSSSPNLSCLNDTVISKIADSMSNLELEAIDDKRDRIQSRLYCKFIHALAKKDPQNHRGHYSSLSFLFKCVLCKKILYYKYASSIPCLPERVRLDASGVMLASHLTEQYWNINTFIKELKSEFKTWRQVYWRLWGVCHYLKCSHCTSYYPVNHSNWCRYHEQFPQFFPSDEGRQFSIVGRYMCCGERTYRFEILPTFSDLLKGCNFRAHQPAADGENRGIMNVLEKHGDLIFLNPPRVRIKVNLSNITKDVELYTEEEPDMSSELVKNEYFSWYHLIIAPKIVQCVNKEMSSSDVNDEEQDDTEDVPDTESGSNCSKLNNNNLLSDLGHEYNYSSTDDIDSSTGDEEDLSDEDSPPPKRSGGARGKKFKRNSRKKKLRYNKRWMSKLSVRSNQDNQREREERLLKNYVERLSRRGINHDSTRQQKCTLVIPRAFIGPT